MNRTYFLALAVLFLAGLVVLFWRPQVVPVQPASMPTGQDESQPLTLRFGHNVATDSAMHQAALRFADEIEKGSEGEIKVSVYPAQQLGNDHQMVEMARAGELDILLTPTAKMSVPVPQMQYADLPFLFPSREDAYAMLDGEPGDMLLQKLDEIGLVGVTFWENGFKQFTGNRPLLKPQDFEGLNMRVMKSRILMEQFRALGAHPIPIDFYATRQALADGVVDGQENPLIAIVSMGFHEVQSDLTLSNHGYLCYVFSISKKRYEQLTPETRELLVTTARRLASWERNETHRREESLLQAVRDEGVTIHTLEPSGRQALAERTAYISDRFEPVIGADILSKTQELLYRKHQANSEGARPIVVGIDTDLSMDAKVSGLAIKRGAILAANELNATGGVLGRPLRIIARDHKGLPTQGQKNIKVFAADPNVVAVLGGQHGDVVSSELELVHQKKLPFLLPWSAVSRAVANGYSPNYVFRVSANDHYAAPYIINHLLNQGYRRPAILYENSVWGRNNHRNMQQRLAELDLAFVYQETINRGSYTDFTSRVENIHRQGADALILVLKPEEGGALFDVMASQGKSLPLFSHWGIVGGYTWAQHQNAIAQLNLEVFQTFSFIANERDRAKALKKRYIDYFDVKSARRIEAPAAVAQSYDLVRLLAMAIEQAGSTERSAVRDALEQLPQYDGAVKRYAPPFTSSRHDALGSSDYIMTRYAEDGALIPLSQIDSTSKKTGD